VVKRDVIVFNGVKFRRYPESERDSDRRYYTPGIADRQRGVRRLHEEVWMAHNGPIPEGHHVHHKDHDHLNNDPSNLEALTEEEHHAHHTEERRASGFYTRPEQLEHLERIRPLAAPWHGSPEGLEWHRQHGKDVWAARPITKDAWEGREPAPRVCDQCGNEYWTRAMQDGRFCSNNCKSAWRRAAGVDDEDRNCARCGTVFRINRYSRTRNCSRSCGSNRAAIGAASKLSWEQAEMVRLVCEWCGSEWDGYARQPGRFCSISCAGKAKYAAASYDLTCVRCGAEFQGKQPTTLCCSRTCAAYYRESRKAAGVQPDGR